MKKWTTSKNIHIFPSALRSIDKDADSKFTNEYNLTSLSSRLADHKSYVESFDGTKIIFILNGYRLIIDDVNDIIEENDTQVWASIKVVNETLYVNNALQDNTTMNTPTIVSLGENNSLDDTENFNGVEFSTTQKEIGTDYTTSFKILEKVNDSWQVPFTSKLKFDGDSILVDTFKNDEGRTFYYTLSDLFHDNSTSSEEDRLIKRLRINLLSATEVRSTKVSTPTLYATDVGGPFNWVSRAFIKELYVKDNDGLLLKNNSGSSLVKLFNVSNKAQIHVNGHIRELDYIALNSDNLTIGNGNDISSTRDLNISAKSEINISAPRGVINTQGDINVISGTSKFKSTKVYGNMEVSGTTTLNNNVSVSGTTTLNNNVSVSGTTTLNNNVSVSGNLNVGSTAISSRAITSGNFAFNFDNGSIWCNMVRCDAVTSISGLSLLGDVSFKPSSNNSGLNLYSYTDDDAQKDMMNFGLTYQRGYTYSDGTGWDYIKNSCFRFIYAKAGQAIHLQPKQYFLFIPSKLINIADNNYVTVSFGVGTVTKYLKTSSIIVGEYLGSNWTVQSSRESTTVSDLSSTGIDMIVYDRGAFFFLQYYE